MRAIGRTVRCSCFCLLLCSDEASYRPANRLHISCRHPRAVDATPPNGSCPFIACQNLPSSDSHARVLDKVRFRAHRGDEKRRVGSADSDEATSAVGGKSSTALELAAQPASCRKRAGRLEELAACSLLSSWVVRAKSAGCARMLSNCLQLCGNECPFHMHQGLFAAEPSLG
jgi:hypothetical protein